MSISEGVDLTPRFSGGNYYELTLTLKLSEYQANLGKLEMQMNFIALNEYLLSRNIHILPLQLAHILRLQGLPLYHKDPFDRILIAQSISENMTLISADSNFGFYDVIVLW